MKKGEGAGTDEGVTRKSTVEHFSVQCEQNWPQIDIVLDSRMAASE